MTDGQRRAIRELERLSATDPDGFEIICTKEAKAQVLAVIDIHIGHIERREGGLELREREEFIISIPPDFPFDRPVLYVAHERFAGFPHVIWSKWICLYQSQIEWNPADGLFGFFDRLVKWLGKAAINDMDPIEGPLEPPHHITDFTQVPFVVRADAPVAAGVSWIGIAELVRRENRVELVGWNDPTEPWRKEFSPALAVLLPESLPMEFPKLGADLFRELEKQGMDRDTVLRYLGTAALLTLDGDPLYLVLGLPMRRAADGTQRVHIAVWTMDSDAAEHLRCTIPAEDDSEKLRSIAKRIADLLYSMFEVQQIKWCEVLEDRPEIIVRRDKESAVSWFSGKKVLVLGCGALGSWTAEIIARANPSLVHLVDNSIVKPGVLARQDFSLDDIGSNKAVALAQRLEAIVPSISTTIESFKREAHAFIMEDIARFSSYDLVLDCTASTLFQMKLERDWAILGRCTPAVLSMIIDANASKSLCVIVGSNSQEGPWGAYIRLKYKLCLNRGSQKFISAFYSEQASKTLFQPEPGCSDPTFAGSTADVMGLASTVLNVAVPQITVDKAPLGITLSTHHPIEGAGSLNLLSLSAIQEVTVGQYRVRISPNVYREARGWVRQNNRLRSRQHETGGIIWGLWDDTVQVIWVFDISGPPPDSVHEPSRFDCGIIGVLEEHERRWQQSRGTCGFIGMWHTHPEMFSHQSITDMQGMSTLVAGVGHNNRRALMMIFGRNATSPTAGLYVYESVGLSQDGEDLLVTEAQLQLEAAVV